jgi:glycosyltransferase involved in cell wall biosynthesis
MKISIIVPAFNEEKMLASSLAAMGEAAKAFEKSADWELIVCDNNSTDRTAEIARAAGAQVIFEPINQISRARNRGASVATGDWLIFIDADSFPSSGLFARALSEMRNPRCAGGGCLLRLDQMQAFSTFFLGCWNLVSRMTHWAAGSFVYCDAKLFRELSGFSERLFASEEIEFCQRLKRAARAQKRRLHIITDERLLTSARKMHLYTRAEHVRFLLRAALLPGRILTSRDQCALWYNGRR